MAFKKTYAGIVIVLDGMNCMYRGYHAHKHLESGSGHPTGALHGVLMHIKQLRNRFPGSELVVVWDGPPDKTGSKGWRFQYAPDVYKAGRQRTEDSARVARQMVPLGWMLHHAGYLQMRVPGVEADDLIALYARDMWRRNYKVIIDSTDKDFFQLMEDGLTVLKTKAGKISEYTYQDVEATYGINGMEGWMTYRALVGDASDGLAGLKGCGPKTAAKLVNEGTNVAYQYAAQPDSLKKKATKEQWTGVQQCAYLSLLPITISNKYLLEKEPLIIQALGRQPPQVNVRKFLQLSAQFELNEVTRDRNKIIASQFPGA